MIAHADSGSLCLNNPTTTTTTSLLHSEAAHNTHMQSPGPICQSKARPQTGALLIPARERTKTVISHGLTRGMPRWQEQRHNCCLSSSSLDVSLNMEKKNFSVSICCYRIANNPLLSVFPSRESHTRLVFGDCPDSKEVCNWFRLRLIICTGRSHCCKPFIRKHIQHTEQMRRAGWYCKFARNSPKTKLFF